MALVIYVVNGKIIVGDVRPGLARFGERELPVVDGADDDAFVADGDFVPGQASGVDAGPSNRDF